jgi:Na+-transporting NADH:ubiquinone oxidoreductase subunit E
MIIREYNLIQSLSFGVGSGLGWMLSIVAMAGIRQKIKNNPIPKGLEGPGITLIITGLMALAFIGFSGIVQIQ